MKKRGLAGQWRRSGGILKATKMSSTVKALTDQVARNAKMVTGRKVLWSEGPRVRGSEGPKVRRSEGPKVRRSEGPRGMPTFDIRHSTFQVFTATRAGFRRGSHP